MPLQWPNQSQQTLEDGCLKVRLGACLENSTSETINGKLQALVYDILLSTTAVFSYAIGSWKMSANEQFFVGAQTVVSLFQTTQIKQGDKIYTSTYRTTIVWIETELSFLSGVDASHVYVRAWALGCFYSLNYQYPNLSEGADRVGGQLRGE